MSSKTAPARPVTAPSPASGTNTNTLSGSTGSSVGSPVLFYRSSGTVVLLYPCEITMIPVHAITTVGAGLALPIGTFLRRRAQQAAPLRFGCRNDKPRCYPHHSRKGHYTKCSRGGREF